MKLVIESLDGECANRRCTNLIFEGPFELVQLSGLGTLVDPRPGSPAVIELLLCIPCSRRLQDIA